VTQHSSAVRRPSTADLQLGKWSTQLPSVHSVVPAALPATLKVAPSDQPIAPHV
jgi:hypothetical protein